jgi:hypothetical protein
MESFIQVSTTIDNEKKACGMRAGKRAYIQYLLVDGQAGRS